MAKEERPRPAHRQAAEAQLEGRVVDEVLPPHGQFVQDGDDVHVEGLGDLERGELVSEGEPTRNLRSGELVEAVAEVHGAAAGHEGVSVSRLLGDRVVGLGAHHGLQLITPLVRGVALGVEVEVGVEQVGQVQGFAREVQLRENGRHGEVGLRSPSVKGV